MRVLCTCFIAMISLLGCASERHAVPAAGELVIPPLKFDLIRDKRISVVIRDRRQESEFSRELVATLDQAVSQSLKGAEVTLDPASKDVLEVSVDQYRADLRLAEWKGCVALSATLKVGDRPEQSSSEQCATEKDTDGVHSGDRAAGRALQDALVLLLHKLDRLGR